MRMWNWLTVMPMKQAFWMQGFGSTEFLALDYFAGSGTTAHALLSLNRQDGGKRKYIMVEQGPYFETALKPRIMKVVKKKILKEVNWEA